MDSDARLSQGCACITTSALRQHRWVHEAVTWRPSFSSRAQTAHRFEAGSRAVFALRNRV